MKKFLILFLLLPSFAWAFHGKVVRVIDGDTIVVDTGSERVRVRLYGIDTPEKKQWYGQNAKQFTASLVAAKEVDVDPIAKDRYGRTVGLVYLGDVSVNQALVRYGYAWVYRKYCKKKVCRRWKKYEQEAREDQVGLWKNPDVQAPWKWRHSRKAGR